MDSGNKKYPVSLKRGILSNGGHRFKINAQRKNNLLKKKRSIYLQKRRRATLVNPEVSTRINLAKEGMI